jgi:hypothetical protein
MFVWSTTTHNPPTTNAMPTPANAVAAKLADQIHDLTIGLRKLLVPGSDAWQKNEHIHYEANDLKRLIK